MKANHFHYEGKTGIAVTKGFEKKGLAELACNIGNICEFGCTFCYVPAVTTKQKYVQEVLRIGHSVDDFSLYRTKANVLDCVERDLKRVSPADQRTVFFCTTCDPCATEEHMDITAEAIALIMAKSQLRVRVLSKGTLILDLARWLAHHRDRIIFGLSTGTSRPEISRAVEGNASPIGDRIAALRELQDAGFRTFGMICPVLPTDLVRVPALVEQVRPEKCELVWAEAVNVRGKSLAKTRQALEEAGLHEDAQLLAEVMGDRAAWQSYCMDLFLGLQKEMDSRGQLNKLCFLQYTVGQGMAFDSFFNSAEGAVCL